jgi:hypothetical protein
MAHGCRGPERPGGRLQRIITYALNRTVNAAPDIQDPRRLSC